jgi:hypothetical protein
MNTTATRTVPVDGIGPVEVTGHPVADFFSLTMDPRHAQLPPGRDRRAHLPDRPLVQHQARLLPRRADR